MLSRITAAAVLMTPADHETPRSRSLWRSPDRVRRAALRLRHEHALFDAPYQTLPRAIDDLDTAQQSNTSPVGSTHRCCLFDEDSSSPPRFVTDNEPQVFLFNAQLWITVNGSIHRGNPRSEYR